MLTPMMAAYVLQPMGERKEPGWLAMYMHWAAWALRHRIKITLAAVGFTIASFVLVGYLPTGFIPPDDLSQTQVTVTLPPGSTFSQTFAAAEQAREIVGKNRM